MDTYIRDVRYKLQSRVNRLKTADHRNFHPELQRFFAFLHGEQFLCSLIAELCARFPTAQEEVSGLQEGSGGILFGTTDAENAAISYLMLKRVHDNPGPQGLSYWSFVRSRDDFGAGPFCEQYLDPFYEYIDEQLEDRNSVLALLIKYKHLAEWFRRSELFLLWKNDPSRGEKALALRVYEYLCQEGIDFAIEPSSVSGEADMVSSQTSSQRLIADIKIFSPDTGKGAAYIKAGFAQVLTYTRDYNEPMGYLVVFNVSGKQLRIGTETPSEPIPRVALSNRTIWLVEIDIFPYDRSASKRGVPEVVTISEADLAREVSGTAVP